MNVALLIFLHLSICYTMSYFMCGVGISFYSSTANRGITHWILQFNIFYKCNSGICTEFNLLYICVNHLLLNDCYLWLHSLPTCTKKYDLFLKKKKKDKRETYIE